MPVEFWFALLGVGFAVSLLLTFKTMSKASKGYASAKKRRIERGPQTPCPICRSNMELVGLQEFKLSDKAESVDKAVAKDLGANGTDLPLEVHRCPTCRNLELFLPPAAG